MSKTDEPVHHCLVSGLAASALTVFAFDAAYELRLGSVLVGMLALVMFVFGCAVPVFLRAFIEEAGKNRARRRHQWTDRNPH